MGCVCGTHKHAAQLIAASVVHDFVNIVDDCTSIAVESKDKTISCSRRNRRRCVGSKKLGGVHFLTTNTASGCIEELVKNLSL